MKKSLAVLSLLSITKAFALNPVPGWYAGAMIGATYAPNVNITSLSPTDLTSMVNMDVKYKVFMDGGLSLGYRIDQFRVEGEALYNRNNIQSVNYNGTTISTMKSSPEYRLNGATTTMGLMLNGLYDLYTPDSDFNFVPYVGLGLGYGHVSTGISFYDNNVEIPGTKISDANNGFAGQVILGGNYFLDDFWAFGMDYRYFATTQMTSSNSRSQFHALNFSLTSAFDSVIG